MDGLTESRRGTVSVFNGPPAAVVLHDTVEDEQVAIDANDLPVSSVGQIPVGGNVVPQLLDYLGIGLRTPGPRWGRLFSEQADRHLL